MSERIQNRTRLVYALLALAWIATLVWQVAEHARVRSSARTALINHAKDVSTTLGVVLRSQRRFGIISRDRIESALSSLLRPDDLDSIALLNNAGETVASAGEPIDFGVKGLVPSGEHWGDDSVILVNLVDLGTNVPPEGVEGRATLILDRTNLFNPFGTNRPPPPSQPPADSREPAAVSATNGASTNATLRSRGGPRPRGGERRPPFGRPFWMSEEDYRSAVEKQGVHSFVVSLSIRPILATAGRDLWLRAVIGLFASVAAVGLGLAWSNLLRSSELEVRLARASELNARLKEMNVAAAGLAHETRNPLNIIRGLAQMISRRDDAPPEFRQRSRDILDEADRVTAQLNEFINYSRPREVRRDAVSLAAVVADVTRALGFDIDEKAVRLSIDERLPVIQADEQLLRQALFNLILNAIQAVDRNGSIVIAAVKGDASNAAIEVRDDGPGVPPGNRTEIFKPYFTTHQKGTGLGLAVVQQIVLAHGWEIECLPNQPRGAVFRISHLGLASAA